MITKQELSVILKKYGFEEYQIESILNKKIKTLLERRKSSKCR